MSDPAKYRTREEVQRMRAEHDCLDAAKKLLEEQGVSEAALKKLDDDIKARVQEAADFAQASPEPDESELWTDILVEGAK
jgi:pyruvate dehydrogenase E1 component alpha subunit